MKKILLFLMVFASLQLIGQSKDSLSFYLSKSNENIMKGLYDRALITCNHALRLDSNNCKALKMKGLALSSLGKTDEAKKHYQLSIKKNCNVINNLLTLKSIYFDEGNNTEALNYLNKVITLSPDSGELYYERWSIKTIMNDKTGASADLEKAKNLGCQSAIKMDKQLKQKEEKDPADKEEKE